MAARLWVRWPGSSAKSAAVIVGCSRGSLRKNQAHRRTQAELTMPKIANDPRHVSSTAIQAISGGARAFPIREKECVTPWAKPQRLSGIQLLIARVAVGKVVPRRNPTPAERQIAPESR